MIRLPIEDAKVQIEEEILGSNQLIIRAEPGSGKTTRVPLFAFGALGGSIVVLEPRRIAARLSAEHVAQSIGEAVGRTVGYRVRYEAQVSNATKILFITEGLFLRLLVEDESLSEIKAVIIDEFHERSLHTDLALALVRKLQETTRKDLRLIVMSATIDLGALKNWMPQASTVDIKGRVYSVEPRYQEPQASEFIDRQISRAIKSHYKSGNVLVFLYSTSEILGALSRLESEWGQFEVLPLTSELARTSLPKIYSGTKPKIILATNVAETSLTLPGVTLVLDSGWHLSGRYSPWSGLPIVEKKKIAKDSAVQRMGRAGRVEAGVCVRLYSQREFDYRNDFTAPEISRVDMTQTLLELYSLKLLSIQDGGDVHYHFEWFQLPELDHVKSAVNTLRSLGAIHETGVSSLGTQMARKPMHPRLSAILIHGERLGYRSFAAWICAQLSEGGADTPDIVSDTMDRMRGKKQGPESERIERFFRSLASPKGRQDRESNTENSVPDTQIATQIILAGFADRLGKILPKGAEQLSNGKFRAEYAFSLGRSGTLEQLAPPRELLIVLGATEINTGQTRKTLINIAAPVEKNVLMKLPRVKVETVMENSLSDGLVYEVERTFYDTLVLEEKRVRKSLVVKGLESEIRAGWPRIFKDYRTLETYHHVIDLLDRRGFKHDFTKLEGEFLDLVISFIADEFKTIAEVRRGSITTALTAHLGFEMWNFYLKEFPIKIKIPSGREVEIHYEEDKDPWIQAKLQEFFSAKKNFTLSRFQIPLTIHLLSPGGKPLQVTADIVRFWTGSYRDIQKEMKSRYPKHPWPDDPSQAPPVLSGRHR
ncbi:MAG: ATP-dependent helicase C-terminal domain-containing protein [Pseudomonadota bacterium]